MKKIWVLVREEVIDFVNYHTTPQAFSDSETAREMFDMYKKSVVKEYADEIEDGWIVEEGDNYLEVYDEEYSKNHYRLDLYEVEVIR